MIPEDKKKDILAAANVFDVVNEHEQLKKSGNSYYCACPKCGASGKNKGLIVTPKKNIAKCFSCDWSPSSVNYLMEIQKKSYPEALQYLADKYNISLQEKPQPKPAHVKEKRDLATFCHKQLLSSGLDEKDITARVYVDEDTEKEVEIFQPGTLDQYKKITTGDDIIIWYYDLFGKPTMYQHKSGKMIHLFRVRYQNPDLHKDLSGQPRKYESPTGSGSHLYIPEVMRRIFKERRQIKRLYIQEGEKKAEKACKHGLPSVGIMGINNIAGKDKKLPYEFELIVQQCGVEEIVFILDADWHDLSTHLYQNKAVNMRPLSFFTAIRNFKEYFKTFTNLNIYLELYFGYVNENEKHDKGIDDILANTLKGNEMDLRDDISRAMNEKDGRGKYITVHKITTIADSKIKELWHLNSAEAFAKAHKDRLKELREFIIGDIKWRFNDKDELELAQPLQDDEQFWEKSVYTDARGNEKVGYKFKYYYAKNFFRNRGWGRIKMASGSPLFCHIESKVVKIVEPYVIKDYAMTLAEEISPMNEKPEIMDVLLRGGKMYFGPDSLSNLDSFNVQFEQNDKESQYLYFKDKYWKITASYIEEKPIKELNNYVWFDKINDFDAQLLSGDFITVTKITPELIGTKLNDTDTLTDEFVGQYIVDFSSEAKRSHFIKFIWNTGEFFWKKFIDTSNSNRREKDDERSLAEIMETHLHFMSKVTAIGYLLHQYFDKSKSKAVIGMDGKLSEVGSSWGGTGKSILGDAIGKVIPQVAIGAKNKKLTEDPFWAEEVTEKTDNVFLDDVRANIDFEFFFPYITGKFTVNPKGGRKFTIPEKDTPKIYMSTNHAIVGEGSSFKRRQFFIAFSDFYNENHIPVNDFGVNFFDEWDQNQWNLFYNFMAWCLRIYFQYGLVEGPNERLELRRMRQFIGENFLAWADEYFGYDEAKKKFDPFNQNINRQIPRKELTDDWGNKYGKTWEGQRTTPQSFKKKIVRYCQFRGALFNPHKFFDLEETRPGADDKSGGVEYFTIANSNYGS